MNNPFIDTPYENAYAPAFPVRIEMPEEIAIRFETLADAKVGIERTMGLVMDEWISELPSGYHETAFEMFQQLYYEKTGRWRETRTLKFWRTCATNYTSLELEEFHALSNAQMNKAVELAGHRSDGTTAADIARWTINNGISKVPAMVEHWAALEPQVGYEKPLPGWLQAFQRSFRRHFPEYDPFYAECCEFFEKLRKKIEDKS